MNTPLGGELPITASPVSIFSEFAFAVAYVPVYI